MERFKLMRAMRVLEGRIEAIEYTLHDQPHVTPTREDRRKYHAYRLQYKAVIARLGGHPSIHEWREYQVSRSAS